jgi:hypothetical protein
MTARRRLLALLLAAPLALALLPVTPAMSAPPGDVRIEVLSGRGDVVSGGDALLRVVRPGDVAAPGGSPSRSWLSIDDDGRDVTLALRRRG